MKWKGIKKRVFEIAFKIPLGEHNKHFTYTTILGITFVIVFALL